MPITERRAPENDLSEPGCRRSLLMASAPLGMLSQCGRSRRSQRSGDSERPCDATNSLTLERAALQTQIAVAATRHREAAPLQSYQSMKEASLTPVDHVFVLMLENRSFDHFFGLSGLPSDPQPTDAEFSSGATPIAQ